MVVEEARLESCKAVLRLFELIVEHGELGVSELSRLVGDPKTTVQRGLTTLHEAGWLRPVLVGGRRRWRPALRLTILAGKLDPSKRLRAVAIPVMGRLRDKTGETVHLTIRDGNEVLLIERVDSRQQLRTVRALGARAPMHVTANGKAILASLQPDLAAQYLETDLVSWTERTIKSSVALADNLKLVRLRGYALSDGEMDIHIRAVGSAILENQMPVAALSVSCPATRLPDESISQIGRFVATAAAEVSRSLDEADA